VEARPADIRPSVLLSVDFEDWDQLVGRSFGLSDWDQPRPSFERQMRRILDFLREIDARVTFFVLGMTARNYPHLIEEIAAAGHELACHGYAHGRVYSQSRDEFRRDVEESMELIVRLGGPQPVGYRAPAFSINRRTPWAYEVLAELGFRYDSSQYDSPRIPERIRGVPSTPYRLELPGGTSLWEFPISVWRVGRVSLPVGGGSYWRVLPKRLLLRAVREVSAVNTHPVLYFHPYEWDPEPLDAQVPPGAAQKERLQALRARVWGNLGRQSVPSKVHELAREFRLVSYDYADAEVRRRYGARSKALSQSGVLV
jgi:polysaccharide deacetylase family protein (PEP-CTERM system associated)